MEPDINKKAFKRARPISWIVPIVLYGAVFFVPGVSHSSETDIPKTVDIDTQALCPKMEGLSKNLKSVKGFSHKRHATIYLIGNSKYAAWPYDDGSTCSACHLNIKGQKDMASKDRCKGLRAALSRAGNPREPKVFFHKTCNGCHRNMKKAGIKTGPTSCKGCHGRNKK